MAFRQDLVKCEEISPLTERESGAHVSFVKLTPILIVSLFVALVLVVIVRRFSSKRREHLSTRASYSATTQARPPDDTQVVIAERIVRRNDEEANHRSAQMGRPLRGHCQNPMHVQNVNPELAKKRQNQDVDLSDVDAL
jgi:hypothetical protein